MTDWPHQLAHVDDSKLKKCIAAKRSQAIGKWGQTMAERALANMGFKCIETVHTGTALVKGTRKFATKVSGDIRAVGRQGKSVLVEVKTRADGVDWSDLKPHQREALSDHLAAGADAFVAWVDTCGRVRFFRWPVFPEWQTKSARHPSINEANADHLAAMRWPS